MSEPTCYKWKCYFSGVTISHWAHLRQLLDQNAKLKRMYGDPAHMHHALKDFVDRKRRPRSLVSWPCARWWVSMA